MILIKEDEKMPIPPTNGEIICAIVWCVLGLGFLLWVRFRNEGYDPKANDPYRHCPKDYDTMGD